MPQSIATIQHGDFRTALEQVESGGPEPYSGMRESVEALLRLGEGRRHLIVSLDAPRYRVRRGSLEMLSVPPPPGYARLPRPLTEARAARILFEVARFRPTHVLLRTGDQLGLRIAQWCAWRRLPTFVVLANTVAHESPYTRRANRRLMQVLNRPSFWRVANYKRVASQSLVEFGLAPEKALEYEFGGARLPKDHPAKSRAGQSVCHVVFAARMVETKGPQDVVAAVRHLHEQGVPVRATLLGDGPFLERVRADARELPAGVVETPGWCDNETMFRLLLSCSFACVPTRHQFNEGMPMALTEALASRSPVVVSDHPVFVQSFEEGEGVRFFRAGHPEHLASVILEVWQDAAAYDRLSQGTLAAFDRIHCATTFGDIIGAWQRELTASTSGHCTQRGQSEA